MIDDAIREASRLPEDSEERRMFNQQAELYGGNTLRRISDALAIWHKMAPAQGSYGKTLAIFSNECADAADKLTAYETARAKAAAPAGSEPSVEALIAAASALIGRTTYWQSEKIALAKAFDAFAARQVAEARAQSE